MYAFDRILVDDCARIQSTCKKCGSVIVSSVSDGIEQKECEHYAMCAGRKPVSSVPSSRRAS
jgi:hypothetical protein